MYDRMPFGKHKGKRFCDIPTQYLNWLVENLDRDNDVLPDVKAALAYRSGHGGRQGRKSRKAWSGSTGGKSQEVTTEIARRWFSRMSLIYHPDRGGSDEEMRVVNKAYEILTGMIKGSV